MAIFACSLLDRLKADALAGDQAALKRLMQYLPQDLPAADRAAERTRRIQGLAEQLRHALPGVTDRRVAKLLALAGARIDDGQRGLDGDQFADLAADERVWLELTIQEILTWAPRRRADGRRWPRFRQI